MDNINFNRVVLLTRGASGSGKSTFAKYLYENIKYDFSLKICSADNYFLKDGQYKFDAQKLGAAHKYCFDLFCDSIKNNDNLIIVDNTNTREDELTKYLDFAKQHKYTVFSLVVENRNNTTNLHGVDPETITKQATRLKESIKLL